MQISNFNLSRLTTKQLLQLLSSCLYGRLKNNFLINSDSLMCAIKLEIENRNKQNLTKGNHIL